MDFTIGDQVQISIIEDGNLTLITGIVKAIGVWRPDVYKFELYGLSSVFYTDDENTKVKVVG